MQRLYRVGIILLEKSHYVAAFLAVVLVFFSLRFVQLEDQLFHQAMENQNRIRGNLKMTLIVHRGAAICLKGLQLGDEDLFFEGLDLLESAVGFAKNFHTYYQLELNPEIYEQLIEVAEAAEQIENLRFEMNQEVSLETIEAFSEKVDQLSSQILAKDSIYREQLSTNNSEILNRVSQSKWFLGILYGFLFALIAGLGWYSHYRKKVEKALQASEEHYRLLAELSPNVIVVHCEGKIVFVNRAGVELLGATDPEQLIEKPIMEFVHPSSRDMVMERMKKMEENPIAPFIEEKFIRLDGTEVEVEVAGQLFNYRGKPAIQVVCLDITARKQAEQERMRLATAIDQSAETVVITDSDDIIQYVNPAFEKISGYSREEAVGRNPVFLSSGKHDQTFFDELWNTITSGKVWKGHMINRKKNGELYTEEMTISPVKDDSGKVTHFITNKRDITQQLSLEEQLRQAQKMESMGVMAGGIAHEFNNLLSPILGFTEMLKDKQPEGSSEKFHLEQIYQAGQRAATLVKQILTFSRKSMSERKLVQLEVIVKEALKFLSQTIPSTISFQEEIDSELPEIMASPHEIHQVIINLCINACHAMPEGGELKVSLKDKAYCELLNSHAQKIKGRFVCLSIQDTGIGMDKTTLEHIFDPFFTTKEVGKGTGLGLSVVIGIVEQHDGIIEVDSTEGEGSTFRLYFPVTQNRDEVLFSSQSQSIHSGKERILLVDDKPMITEVLSVLLEDLGYQVTSYTDGHETLTAFQADPQNFDLVITDYTMPKMTGRQLTEKLKQIRSKIPVILITGYSEMITEESVQSWGIDALLMKPPQKDELSRVVRKVLDQTKS